MLPESRIACPPSAAAFGTRTAIATTFRPMVSQVVHLGLGLVVIVQLSGCSPVGMAVGAGATAANMAMEERGFGNAVRDNVIWTDINGRLLHQDATLFRNVNLQVHEGRVLLTGFVQKPEDRVEATRIAWEPDGVREVINDVKLGRSRDFGDISQDQFLVQEINLKLLLDRDIRANNYSVDCIRSTVYLMGVARTQAELQRVIDHVRDVPYVRAVVSHVRVRTDPLPPIPDQIPAIPPAGAAQPSTTAAAGAITTRPATTGPATTGPVAP
ncbi:MAG TPA: BON domain-containing protein [Dongiaceae bacterium]|jgi:osmotically-inducible protein OsmY|nr:BON domain-containing protein [Dongiaceae bacterium]